MKSMHLLCTLTVFGLAACSTEAPPTQATAEDLARSEQVLADAEKQMEELDNQLKPAMQQMVQMLGKSCDQVSEFEQPTDSRLEVTCQNSSGKVTYIIDKTDNSIREK